MLFMYVIIMYVVYVCYYLQFSSQLSYQQNVLFFERWFSDFKELDYARSGNVATYDLRLDAGTDMLLVH